MTEQKQSRTSSKTVLVIDDEKNMRHMLAAMLNGLGYEVRTASDGRDGIAKLDDGRYDFILCDIRMAGMDGLDFLRSAGDRISAATVIMMSAYGTIDTAMEAMQLGAYDYISKPFKTNEVHLALKKAEERESLRQENRRLKDEIRKLAGKEDADRIIGKSPQMEAVLSVAEKASRYATTVLITGESGTGKELIARRIHYHGPRREMPLVTINCGSIPENLLESEFFGYRKGAFTGADSDRRGLFEEADGGTIFLDEIGELPSNLQVKLLRVLQESEIRPVGATRTRRIDVRVIAATAKDLTAAIREGAFVKTFSTG
jgi:two-component system response regulator AtoC